MAVTTCIAGAKNNNLSVIAQAGAVTDTQHTSSVTMNTLTLPVKIVGSKVYEAVSAASSGNLGTIRPYTAGVFSSFEKGQYIMKVGGNKISQVATTLLRSTANLIPHTSINFIKTTHTGFLTALAWSSNRDGDVTYTLTQSAQVPDFGTDDEVTTLGNLVYRTGKPLPVQAAYSTPNSY